MYPVDTPQQLRSILRALRKSNKVTQAQLGERLGVSQKRIAQIESAPELTSYDQIARLVSALGAHLYIQDAPVVHHVAEPSPPYGNDTW
jgi:HTH-type transcriptional regulator/antitoxin HipB